MSSFYYINRSTKQRGRRKYYNQKSALPIDKVFIDVTQDIFDNKPQLNALLNCVNAGDVIYCDSIAQISSTIMELLRVILLLNSKGIGLICFKENLDTTSAEGQYLLNVFHAMAKLEKDETFFSEMKSKTTLSIIKKTNRGKPRIKIDSGFFKAVCTRWRLGEITAVEAMEITGLKANTFYRRVKEMKL